MYLEGILRNCCYYSRTRSILLYPIQMNLLSDLRSTCDRAKVKKPDKLFLSLILDDMEGLIQNNCHKTHQLYRYRVRGDDRKLLFYLSMKVKSAPPAPSSERKDGASSKNSKKYLELRHKR